MRANQSDRANRYRQNDRQHHRILCHILAFFLPPGFEKIFSHSTPPGLPVSSATDAPECLLCSYDTMAHPGSKPTNGNEIVMTKVTPTALECRFFHGPSGPFPFQAESVSVVVDRLRGTPVQTGVPRLN